MTTITPAWWPGSTTPRPRTLRSAAGSRTSSRRTSGARASRGGVVSRGRRARGCPACSVGARARVCASPGRCSARRALRPSPPPRRSRRSRPLPPSSPLPTARSPVAAHPSLPVRLVAQQALRRCPGSAAGGEPARCVLRPCVPRLPGASTSRSAAIAPALARRVPARGPHSGVAGLPASLPPPPFPLPTSARAGRRGSIAASPLRWLFERDRFALRLAAGLYGAARRVWGRGERRGRGWGWEWARR